MSYLNFWKNLYQDWEEVNQAWFDGMELIDHTTDEINLKMANGFLSAKKVNKENLKYITLLFYSLESDFDIYMEINILGKNDLEAFKYYFMDKSQKVIKTNEYDQDILKDLFYNLTNRLKSSFESKESIMSDNKKTVINLFKESLNNDLVFERQKMMKNNVKPRKQMKMAPK